MKLPILLCSLILAAFVCSPCLAQNSKDAAGEQTEATVVEPFTGKILFHCEGTGVFYAVNVVTSGDLNSRWLSQCQQFHVDLTSKQVTLEHMLHGYGLTTENSGVATAHVLDAMDGLVRLVGPK